MKLTHYQLVEAGLVRKSDNIRKTRSGRYAAVYVAAVGARP